MKNASPYKCNVCGKAKEDSNHWWLLFPSNTPDAPGSGFILDRWDDVYADRKDVENICSESCASKALSKWMEKQKVAAAVSVAKYTFARLPAGSSSFKTGSKP